jgi:hypothetical protein
MAIAATSLTEELLVDWQTEATSLVSAESQRNKLFEAHLQQEDRERRLHQIQQEILQIPSEAQRSLAAWVWSSKQRKVVFGVSVVLLVWTDGQVRLPLAFRLWRKGGPSKFTRPLEV